MLAVEPVDAQTGVVANSVETGSTILARKRGAIVGVYDAVTSLVAFRADAVVGTVGVPAGGAVAARRSHHTLVYVLVAETSGVTDRAGTGKVQEI